MKKIINGKKYDLQTAKMLFALTTTPGLYFKENSESLFVKETGEFFLLVSILGEKTIHPMTEEEAHKWGETVMTVAEYESIFGEVKE